MAVSRKERKAKYEEKKQALKAEFIKHIGEKLQRTKKGVTLNDFRNVKSCLDREIEILQQSHDADRPQEKLMHADVACMTKKYYLKLYWKPIKDIVPDREETE